MGKITFNLISISFLIYFAKFSTAQDYLLPVNIKPVHYDLKIQPFISNQDADSPEYLTANGEVDITILCTEPTNSITLHIRTPILEVTNRELTDLVGNPIELNDGNTTDPENDFYNVTLTNGNLAANTNYHYKLSFSVKMRDAGITGLYLDYYYPQNNRNNKTYLSTTLFAPNDARKAFPCFDEPNLRATYEIKLVRREGYISLSNTNISATVPMPENPGWFIDTFIKSEPMSSYIVAFVVCDFTYAESKLDGLSAKVYATPDFISAGYGEYAANLNSRVLYFYENYFNQTYMLDKFGKFDSFAVPQFQYSAMENWALVAYKEPVLLYHANETSQLEKSRIDTVVPHEIAHQFFGNLVNFEFWSNLWLSEGFATFYSYVGLNFATPEFEAWKMFITDALQLALDFDASPGTHPIYSMPSSNAAIGSVYTRIVYEKAASIMRMIEGVISKEVFHSGIQSYLENNKWNGANQDFVFEELQIAFDKTEITNKLQSLPTNLSEIYKSWTDKTGFPLVQVSYGFQNNILLEQKEYGKTSDSVWWIPIWLKTEKQDVEEITWISNKEVVAIPIDTVADSDFPVIINPYARGYYRVLYQGVLEQRIMTHYKSLNPEARCQILDDYFKFASFLPDLRYRSISTALQFTKDLQDETEYIVWKNLLEYNIPTYFNRLYDSDIFTAYFSYKINLALNAIGNSAQINERHVNKLTRRLFMENLIKFGKNNFNFVIYSAELVTRWNSTGQNPIDPNIQQEVYSAEVYGESNFETANFSDFFIEQYKVDTSKVQRLRYMKALSCATDTPIVNKVLDFIIDNTTTASIWDEDRVISVQNIARNPFNRISLLNHIGANIDRYISVFGQPNVANFISLLSTYLKTVIEKTTLTTFRDTHAEKLSEVIASITASIARIDTNIAWLASNRVEIESTLLELGTEPTTTTTTTTTITTTTTPPTTTSTQTTTLPNTTAGSEKMISWTSFTIASFAIISKFLIN